LFLVDAEFEVLGAQYSLLSVSLSASQKLYTRRGTLVGLTGKAENVSVTSTGISDTLLTLDIGTLDFVHTRTLSKSRPWHPFPISKIILDKPNKGFNIYKISTHFL